MDLTVILLIFPLILRHPAQLWIDAKNTARCHVAKQASYADGRAIVVCYLAILIGCLFAINARQVSGAWSDIVGLTLVWGGAILGIASLWQLGRSYAFDICLYPESRLVMGGIYSLVRHPMRLGLALEALGLVFVAQLPWLLVFWILILSLQGWRTRDEEQFLYRQLGDKHKLYCQLVPCVNLIAGIYRRIKTRAITPSGRIYDTAPPSGYTEARRSQ